MTYAAALRSYGFMKNVMLAAVFMNTVNIFGNFILINGFGPIAPMGVSGAAVSTVISRAFGLVLMVYLFKRKTNIEVSKKFLKPFPWSTMKNILHIGYPSGAE